MGKKSRGKAAAGAAKERPAAAKPQVISAERVISPGHTERVWAVAISPDGRRVISGSPDKTLRVWDLETGRPLKTLEGHAGDVYSVAMHPDGRRAISRSHDATLRVWDLEGGRCLATLEGHTAGVTSVAVHPDGRRVISGSRQPSCWWRRGATGAGPRSA